MAKAGPARPIPPPLESIISYKLLAAYIIARLSVDSILDNNKKTLIVVELIMGRDGNTWAALIKVPNHTKYPRRSITQLVSVKLQLEECETSWFYTLNTVYDFN